MTSDVYDNESYEMQDGDRTILLDGWLIGASSSQDFSDPKPRWTEIKIYVSVTGTFAVNVIGKSSVPGEKDRSRVHVSETADGAVECLHQVDEGGIRYLTRTANQAARNACENDDEFRQAFQVQRIG